MKTTRYRGLHSETPEARNQRSKVCFLKMFGLFVVVAISGLVIDLVAFHDREQRFVYRVVNERILRDSITADLLYLGQLDWYSLDSNPICKKLQISINRDSEEEITIMITDSLAERFQVQDLNQQRFTQRPSTSKGSLSHRLRKKAGSRIKAQRAHLPKDGWGDLDIILSDEHKNFNLKISRKSTGEDIFYFGNIEFIFSNRYIQIGTTLNTADLWGLGERVTTTFNYKNGSYTLWNKHQIPGLVDDGTTGKQGSGFHPMYLRKQASDGKWHVMFFQTSNGLTFSYNQNSNLTFFITGGIVKMKLFVGDYPSDVVEMYHNYLGNYKVPPFWATGYHQSKSGYSDSNILVDVWENFVNHSIPIQAIWSDLNYLDKGDAFSIDTIRFNISQMKQKLLNQSQEYIRWIPSMTITINEKQNISQDYKRNNELIKSANYNNTDLIGCSDNLSLVVFPDYNKLDTWNSLRKNLNTSQTTYGIEFDGMWLFGSEMYNYYTGQILPTKKTCSANATSNSSGPFDSLPYKISNVSLSNWSINTNAIYYHGDNSTVVKKTGNDQQLTDFNFHNLNAFAAIKALSEALDSISNQSSTLVMSKSTVFGAGRYGGHFVQDNNSTFEFLRYSLITIFNFQLFGMPFTGVSICGGYGKVDPELCARWMSLGSMYPFAMNYNADVDDNQEPYAFPQNPYVEEASRRSLQLRYSLLKYYYSEYANNLGAGSVFNPLFYNFPDDQDCIDNDRQAMIGPALLITPVLERSNTPNVSTIRPYFPEGAWYSLVRKDLKFIGPNLHTFNVNFDEPCPTFLRQGYVIVYQSATALGKKFTRTRELDNNFSLAIALEQADNGSYIASGYVVGINDYNDYSEKCTKQRNDCVIDINCTAVFFNNLLNLTVIFESSNLELRWNLTQVDVYMRHYQSKSISANQSFNRSSLNYSVIIDMKKEKDEMSIS